MNNNKEIRTINTDLAEIRFMNNSSNVGRLVSGYGVVFNSESNLITGVSTRGIPIKFREIILPSAIEGVLERSNILALIDHNINRGVLARSDRGMGSLKLSVDSKGVKYSFEAPYFSLGDELIEGIKRGDIKASSFAFSIDKDGERIQKRNDGTYLRTVTKFDEIYDMSPCYREAYEDTTVALRSLDEFKNTEDFTNETETKPVTEEPVPEPIVKVPTDKSTMGEKGQYLKQKNFMLKLKNN